MTTARHPNRTGLRATTTGIATGGEVAQAAGDTSVLACRCPARTVSGTLWAYDSRLGWHDPAEHSTWTPPRQPTHAPLPVALRDWTAPSTVTAAADRRHALAPAGHSLVVCTTCGLCFDAGACTRSGRPLPACQPRTGGVSVPGPTVLSNAEEDA